MASPRVCENVLPDKDRVVVLDAGQCVLLSGEKSGKEPVQIQTDEGMETVLIPQTELRRDKATVSAPVKRHWLHKTPETESGVPRTVRSLKDLPPLMATSPVEDSTGRRKRRYQETRSLVVPSNEVGERLAYLTSVIEAMQGTIGTMLGMLTSQQAILNKFDQAAVVANPFVPPVKEKTADTEPRAPLLVPTPPAVQEVQKEESWSRVSSRRKKVATPTTTPKEALPKLQGNGQAAPVPSYREVAARRLIGHRRTTVVLSRPAETMDDVEIVEAPSTAKDAALKAKLTMEPRPAPTHEVVALRFERLSSRQKVSARDWRQILKEKEIVPYTILFPHFNTIEVVIPKDQEKKTKAFFQAIDRQPVNPNPFSRRDGKTEALSDTTIQRIVTERIHMLQYERSVAAACYIEITIREGIKPLKENAQKQLLQQMESVKAEKGLNPRKPLSNSTQENSVTSVSSEHC